MPFVYSKNYDAWRVQPNEFPANSNLEEKIKFLLSYAILAPSAHNTQPWMFSIKNNRVDFFLDPSRQLTVSDPTGREAYISIGCCIKNFHVTLEAYQIPFSVEYFPEGEDQSCIARFNIQDQFNIEHAAQDPMLQAITKRQSNRSFHKMDVSQEVQRKVEEYAQKIFDQQYQIHIIKDGRKKQLADIAVRGTDDAMSTKEFREELSSWVKNNYTTSGLGMPGFLMNVPGPISLILPRLVKAMKPPAKSLEEDRILLSEKTYALCILTLAQESKSYWLHIGERCQEFLLFATTLGLSSSFYAAGIERGNLYKEIQQVIQSHQRPVVFFRLGIASQAAKLSPRLGVNECLIKEEK